MLLALRDRQLDPEKVEAIAAMILQVLGYASSGPDDLARDLFRGPVRVVD